VDRLFLDASVLFPAAYRARAGIRCLWTIPGIELVTSSYACGEVQRNLMELDPHGRPAISEREQLERLDRLIALVRALTVVADPPDRPLPAGITLPDKDRPILLAAVEAKATHLLTADKKHFGPYFGQTIEGVLILPPDQYLKSRSVPPASET